VSEQPATEGVFIERLSPFGLGLAEALGGRVEVPFALPGETVRIERAVKRARLVGIEEVSPDRIAPFCQYYTRCGGCLFQHLREDVYAAWKREKVAGALAAHGLDAPLGDLIDAHGEGRRRMVLHVRPVDGRARAGFMAIGTHDLVPIEACPIAVPALAEAPRVAEALAKDGMAEGKPLDVAVTATSAGLDVDLRGSGRPGERKIQNLISLAQTFDLARLSIHGEALIERRAPAISMGGSVVVPPPGSFLQATARGEDVLATEVAAAAGKAKRIVDLFSGAGPFTLRLAQKADVHAVEGQAAMLAALDRAARETSGLRRVTTETRDLFRRPLLGPELERYDLAVLDPPRQGAEAQVRQIVPSSLDRVIMVSCDAGTFARDAAALVAGGFVPERVTPVDQFKWSAHVEVVGVFGRPRAGGRKGGRRR
jgi:23S rRNA (uracil1939-C5)-methyltransferase